MGPSASPELRTLAAFEVDGRGELFERLGAERGREVCDRLDRRARALLERFAGREVERAERVLAIFENPGGAVGFCLACHQDVRALAGESGVELSARAAVDLGEVVVWENAPEEVARGARPVAAQGPARADLGRLLSLARGGQTLLGRAAYDLARRAAVDGGPLRGVAWREHGSYRFPDAGRVLEIFEAGVEGIAPLAAPEPGAGPPRPERLAPEAAWRPAAGQPLPGRRHWSLDRRLADSAFGEVWLAAHRKTRDVHSLRFCGPAQLPRLKRQLAVGRRLREELAEPPFLVRHLDSHVEAEPYFLESEYLGAAPLPAWADSRGGLARIPAELRRELAAQLADVLAALHSAGFALGDLRPELVLVAGDGERPRVVLTELSRCGVLDPSSGDRLPGGGAGGCGPEPYRAPELGDGDAVSRASDLYAFGILLYQLAAGAFDRRPGPFWQRDVGDELLCEELEGLLEPAPARRCDDAAAVARRLRALAARRAERRAAPVEPGSGEPKGALRKLLRRVRR